MSSQVFASLRQFNDQYRPVGVAERTEPTATDGPLTVTVDRTFGDVPDPAVVLVPGGGAPTTKTMGNQVVGDYLRQAAETVPVVGRCAPGRWSWPAAGLLEGPPDGSRWTRSRPTQPPRARAHRTGGAKPPHSRPAPGVSRQ